ncbi:MAG: ImmA/IrrE family metallo-endopeptidase [Actinomycetia bacterium]|nr:ImmA/IrrE family metallo-endopeptidase [Actinomycetes bacterium]
MSGPGRLDEQAGERAARFRTEHHLGTQPLGDLPALIEQTTGIDVAVLDAGPDEHGLTMCDPLRGVVYIAVARTSHPMRQRSTLAHELAHVLFEDWNGGELDAERSTVEVRADAFARHLLVPVAGLHELLGSRDPAGPAVLSQVVQRFLVSPAIAGIALRDAGYIDEATRWSWREIMTPGIAARYGWADQYRALCAQSAQRRAPQRLLARAIDGYLARVVAAQTIASLRGMTVAEIEDELRAVGLVPVEHAAAWADPAELPDVALDLTVLDEDPPPGSTG